MCIHTYVVEHDVGFAPNPFYGICTLAACKPRIRKKASKGDYILGFGSAKHGYGGLLVYWMKVGLIISFENYWSESQFNFKKPVMNGSLMQVYGDNIYYREASSGDIKQLFSFHSREDGTPDVANIQRDTLRTGNVLIGSDFLYLGRNALKLPDALCYLEKRGIGENKYNNPSVIHDFEAWAVHHPGRGFQGMPIDWEPVVKKLNA